ncbi:MAG TPA: helix-turn-helix transcriptional regulator [Flavisolibacter sp.]|jgi:AraC-like DNA-binding protein|nr:helix-turn-helix transcriptional regulator [Flavisolibacter sp.]
MKQFPVRHIRPDAPVSGTPTLRMRHLQDVLEGQPLVQDLHRHEFYFILAIETGSGSHEIDFIPYAVQDKTIFCMRPGQVHQLELKPDSTGYLLEFQPGFYEPSDKDAAQRLHKASNKSFCRLEPRRFEKLLSVLSLLFHEYTNREPGYEDALRANLDYFFIEFVRQSPDPKGKPAPASNYQQQRFEEFRELVQKHCLQYRQVSFYTEQMSLSAYQLNQVVRTATGKPASTLIMEQVLLEAKRYLLGTTYQIKDIADILGFEDPSYFVRFFKKQSGSAPETFRTHFTKMP